MKPDIGLCAGCGVHYYLRNIRIGPEEGQEAIVASYTTGFCNECKKKRVQIWSRVDVTNKQEKKKK